MLINYRIYIFHSFWLTQQKHHNDYDIKSIVYTSDILAFCQLEGTEN